MSSPRALAPLLALLLLTACPEPAPKVDPTDGGVTQDAGPDTDAGSDAGPETDAGTALGITTDALPEGYASREYSVTLAATGGMAPYEWSLATGTLPEGLTLSVEGVLSGTPTGALQSSFTVSVRDSAGTSAQAPLSLTTYALPSITELPAQSLSVGDDVAVTLEVTGGKGPFLFSYATPPPGLTVTQMGILQGTLSEAGTFTITVTAMDLNGVTATRAITFNVQPRFAITTPGLPWGTRSESYAFTLTAAYGREPLSWSTTSSLPAGVTLSATGVLAGTPAEQGTFDLTVAVQDADGKTASRQLALSVRAPDSPVFTVGQWNLTYFGSDTQGPIHSSSNGGTSDDLQIAHARDIIRDEAANLWGLVEMVDTADFDALKAQLPGFNGFLANNTAFVSGGTSPYGNSSQKPGILYDSSLTFQSARLILTDQLTDFSNRPPLRVDFTTEIGGVETPLVVIVVHMRANSADPTGPRDSRQRASAALKAYLDQNLPTQHVLVLGDWNDDVDESISLDPGSGAPLPTPYENLVSDPARYTFITRELSLAGDDTTIGFENVVDHTLASNEVAARYVSRSAGVQYVDEQLPDFINIVSDHRPVTSTYVFSAETGPFLRLKSPQGGTYQAGSVLPVTWTSFGVSNVRVEASTDGGTQWNVVAASVPAVNGSYAWTLPDIDSSTVLVRVVDASNPERSDTSDAALTLVTGTARVIINEFLADEPAINGNPSPAYEFVEIVNTSPFSVDISGWSLWDSTNGAARHVFPSGIRLGAGKGYVVFGGAAAVPAGRTNAAAATGGTLGLGNSSDTVRIRLPNGTVVDQFAYTTAHVKDNVSANRSPDGDPAGTFVLHDSLPSGTSSSPGTRTDGSEF